MDWTAITYPYVDGERAHRRDDQDDPRGRLRQPLQSRSRTTSRAATWCAWAASRTPARRAQTMGKRISDMRLGGKPIEAAQDLQGRGLGAGGRGREGRPIWDVVTKYLRDKKTIAPVKLNQPKLVGVEGNPGHRVSRAARRRSRRVAGVSLAHAAGLSRDQVARHAQSQVTPRAFYVQGQPGIASAENEGFNSNAGFVVTDEGVVVIDALGTPALGQALLAGDPHVTDEADPARDRDALPRRPLLRPQGRSRTRARRSGRTARRRSTSTAVKAQRRLEQRARDLFPWVERGHAARARRPLARRATRASRWAACASRSRYMGPAHSPEDLIVVGARRKA